MNKTVVIGLDGSNWPLIEPWIEDGSLQNFDRLRRSGAWGVCQSYLPPVTCPNWKCYSSGKNPGKLGVYWWESINTDSKEIHLPDSSDFTAPEIWDYLNAAGKRAGIINLPMSYPPQSVDEFVVAGGPRSREINYTKPEDLQTELERRFDYRIHPENILTSNRNVQEEVEMVYDLLRTRLRTARTLLEERDLDFLHVTLFHLNVLQHYFWNSEETRRAYEIIDEELTPFVEGDYNIVLMSDHGCTEIDTVFYVNRWLESQGYLQTSPTLVSRLHDVGLTQERFASIARSVGLEKYIRPFIPRRIIEWFPTDDGVVREAKLNMVDWKDTTAIGSGQGLIYVVADTRTERERIIQSLKADLGEITGPAGNPIARKIYTPAELYGEGYRGQAPDLIFEQYPGVHTSEAMGDGKAFGEPNDWRAENVPDGMMLFHGENVGPKELQPIQISDIAPTLLHWMGLSVPADMDGTPVMDIFAEGSEPAERPVEFRSPLTDRDGETPERDRLDGEVEDRLSNIGYLE